MTYNGRRVSYWMAAPSQGAASHSGSERSGVAVLLHGLGADHRGLLPLAASMPGVDIVAIDLPGFGQSEPLAGAHTLGAYADVVEAVCAHLDLSTVSVVGHSLGASIALAHASAYPARVDKLAMLMPVTSATGPATWLPRGYYLVGSMLPAAVARVWFLSRAAIFIADETTLMTRDTNVRRRILREDYRTAALASPRAIQEIYRSMRRAPFLALARRIRARTLIVGAQRDSLAPTRVLSRLHTHVTDSQMVVVPEAGHLWPVEHPEAAGSVLMEMLRPPA